MSAYNAQSNDRHWAAFIPPSANGSSPWSAAAIVCVAILAFVSLFAATAYLTVQRIQNELDRDVRLGLEANGINPEGLNISWRYRDVKVTGELASETTQQQLIEVCLLYTSPSPRDQRGSRMPSSA